MSVFRIFSPIEISSPISRDDLDFMIMCFGHIFPYGERNEIKID